MDVNLPYYLGGGQVHAGDRVRYKGESGHIAFVSDGDSGEFAPGYEEYRGCDAGIMFCSDDGELTFFSEPTAELEFVGNAEISLFGAVPPIDYGGDRRPPPISPQL